MVTRKIRENEILDECVYVKLKPYNSYCVDKLWIGFTSGGRKEGSLDPGQIKLMKVIVS